MKDREKIYMCKVSIIIPVYNAEKYLDRCLDSVLGQTLKEIEIVCVDDGSTDKSLEILKRYAMQDSRIVIIHKDNGGLISARKAGIAAARGKYTGYVDSDDWIEPDMYENLYRVAEKNQVALVTCGYYLEGNYVTEHRDTVEEGLYLDKKMEYLRNNLIYNMKNKETGLRASLCCKLFDTSLIREIQNMIPNSITIAEDKMCLLAYVLNCKSVYVSYELYYHYWINPNSMTHEVNLEYLICVNEVYKFLVSLYEHDNFSSIMRAQAELYITDMLLKGINTRLGFQNDNLFWVDPYWLDKISYGAKVVLYGAGTLGRKYRKQLESRKDLEYVTCVDFAYEHMATEDFFVESPISLSNYVYDFIVITIKNSKKADEVKQKLLELRIPNEKVLWFEQPEIFWKYAQADGLLEV